MKRPYGRGTPKGARREFGRRLWQVRRTHRPHDTERSLDRHTIPVKQREQPERYDDRLFNISLPSFTLSDATLFEERESYDRVFLKRYPEETRLESVCV